MTLVQSPTWNDDPYGQHGPEFDPYGDRFEDDVVVADAPVVETITEEDIELMTTLVGIVEQRRGPSTPESPATAPDPEIAAAAERTALSKFDYELGWQEDVVSRVAVKGRSFERAAGVYGVTSPQGRETLKATIRENLETAAIFTTATHNERAAMWEALA